MIFFHKTAKIRFFSFFLEIYFYTSFLYTRNVEKKEREEQDRKGNRKKGKRENEVEICIEMTGAGFNEKYMSAPPRKLRYRGKL